MLGRFSAVVVALSSAVVALRASRTRIYAQLLRTARSFAGLKRAIERGWLWMHERGTYVKLTMPARSCSQKSAKVCKKASLTANHRSRHGSDRSRALPLQGTVDDALPYYSAARLLCWGAFSGVIMEGFAKVVTAFAYLLWPLLGFYFIYSFGQRIIDFLSRLSEGSVKAFGIEAKVIATSAIVQADRNAEKSSTAPAQIGLAASSPAQLAEIRRIAIVVNDSASDELQGKGILWVDDKPENNYLEMQALSALGLRIRTATTTEVAIADIRTTDFDVVISDMKRGDNEEAGYDLLGLILTLPRVPPLIFYTRSKLDFQVATTRGAFGIATKASDLVLLVRTAVAVTRRS